MGQSCERKLQELSLRFGIEGFKCSDGWISRFNEHHGLSFKTVSAETAAVDEAVASNWQQTRLKSLLLKYSPADIYNADEMRLFFMCLSNQTLCHKGERVALAESSAKKG